jgi:Type ISP C-terminal specificity domain/N-6 DNA Methylase
LAEQSSEGALVADQDVDDYLRRLDQLRRQSESTPELSLREPLLRLIRLYGASAGRHGLIVAPEASAGDVGQPDIYVKDGPRLIGFAETKAPGSPLAKLLRSSAQLRSYSQSLANWVLTDYYVFIFIENGEVGSVIDVREDPGDLRARFGVFFDSAPRNIRSASRLAEEMARRARLLRDGLLGALRREPPGGQLRITLDFYRKHLMDDLSEQGFADTFAQTAVYGMFLGWLRWSEQASAAPAAARPARARASFSRRLAVSEIPRSVPFLRSSMSLLTSEEILPPPVTRLLDDLAALFDNTAAGPILRETSAAGLSQGHDPTLYFYERFLEKYDAGERQKRGVYYTPGELVSYVVKAVHALLRAELGRGDGLADPAVILLDPAVGTGTFLLGAAEQALSVVEPQGSAAQHRLIRDHLLPHYYGFELLPAPYAVAHLKVGSFFDQRGYKLTEDDHAHIYLTNTLNPDEHASGELELLPIFSAITDEAIAAGRVKHEVPVLVVLGNPPYERTSHNANRVSDRLQEDFYMIDGRHIPDRNTAPLKDDYLRFIRWATWKLLEQDSAPQGGILAFVTNRAFVERTLHRGVRKFLLDRFDEIYVYDLHGDQREWFKDRIDDKVFKQVQAGIAVTILVKRPAAAPGRATVRYREAWGTRQDKLAEIASATIDDAQWSQLRPHAPLWLMVPYDVPAAYDTWPAVTQIFPANVIGVQTHRDQLVVADTEQALRDRLRRFADPDVPDGDWEQQGVKTNRDWNLREARAALRAEGPRNVRQWNYRGLERRWVAFDDRLIDYTRTKISPHLAAGNSNLALAFANGSLPDGPYVVASRGPVPAAVLSWRTFGAAYMAPLWIHGPLAEEPMANLASGLIQRLSRAGISITPEGLLGYVYGVLNSPRYRHEYADGLRYGFARIPLARDPAIFGSLARHGTELVRLHLFEHPGLRQSIPRMDGDDRATLSSPAYDPATRTVRLGETLTAAPVTPEMWAYQQGAYPTLRAYLEERQGRALVAEEFDDFRNLAAAVRLTIASLPQIDAIVAEAARDSFACEDLGLAQQIGE